MHALKITLLKTFTAVNVFNNVILARNIQLPDDDRMTETCRSIFKSFNVNNLSVCIGWCADQVSLTNVLANENQRQGLSTMRLWNCKPAIHYKRNFLKAKVQALCCTVWAGKLPERTARRTPYVEARAVATRTESLPLLRSRQPYSAGSLYPTVHLLAAAVLVTPKKETRCILKSVSRAADEG